jgi:hypothetical protein
MKTTVLLLIISLLSALSAVSRANSLVEWNFQTDYNPSLQSAGISGSAVTTNNITLVNPAIVPGGGAAITTRDWLGGFDSSRYISFALTNTGSSDVELDDFDFEMLVTGPGTGPTNFELCSSQDGFTSSLLSTDSPAYSWTTEDVSLPPFLLQPSDSIEFRMIAWGANSVPPQGGYLYVSNVSIQGESVPEPSTWGMTAAGIGSLFLFRLRRSGSK